MTNPFRKASVIKRLFSLLVIVTFSLSYMPIASAQDDFDFSDDSGDDGFGSDDFNFSDDDGIQHGPAIQAEKFVMPNNGKPVNLVFFEPVDGTPQKTLDQLTESTLDQLKDEKYAEYDSVKAIPVKQALDAMSPDDRMVCVDDPACLANTVKDLGAANIIVGRIYTENRERPQITFDLIDIASATSKNSIYFDTQNRLRKQEQDISGALIRLFGIDAGSLDALLAKKETVNEGPKISKGQLGAGIAVGIVALGAIGAGIYFGLQAKDFDDKVKNAIEANKAVSNEDLSAAYDTAIRQETAKGYADDASKNAMIANILFATGAVAAVVSIIVFLVRSDKDEDIFATKDNLYISPSLTGEGGGVVAGFSF